MDDLDRLFTRLVHNMRTDFPHLIGRQFQVSDIYQHIVPYRHNRRELGFETNADYEVALLRLLSGERGAMMGDAAMQDTIRRELAMPVPNTELYREFSDTMVSLAPDALARLGTPASAPAVARADATGGAAAVPAPVAREAEPLASARQAAPPAPASPAVAAPSHSAPSATARPATAAPAASTASAPPASNSDMAPRRAPAERASTDRPADRAPASDSMAAARESATSTLAGAESGASGVASSGAGRCRYCGGSLPDGRHVTFCPHCGQNLSVQQCPACGTELEIGWRFCVTCGREVG
jgi:hypothetical protein